MRTLFFTRRPRLVAPFALITQTPLLLGLLALVIQGCAQSPLTPSAPASASSTVAAQTLSPEIEQAVQAMLAPWPGDYGGVPQLQWLDDPLYLAALKPAVELGIARHESEIDAIASSAESATFTNTVVALDTSGSALDRALTYYWVWSGNESSPEFREVQKEIAPLLAAHEAKIAQNRRLLERLAAIKTSTENASLSAAQKRLLDWRYDRFARNGATLTGKQAQRYQQIEQELAQLYQRFSANLLADEEGYVTFLDANQLGGVPDSVVSAAATAASERGREGAWAITNTRSSMDPFLTYSTERELREQVWRNYYARGDHRGEHDNVPLVSDILQLRHERVQLLGYDNYAQWRLANRMAQTPERANDLLLQLWPAATAKVGREVAAMQAQAEADGAAITIEPWDYRFYADKVRRARFALDSNEVRQYLQLNNLVEALFYVGGELFGFDFAQLPKGEVPVADPDVRVWRVSKRADSTFVGLFYLDPYARTGKGSGAWANSFRSRSTLERWLLTPPVVANYLRHHETNAPMPAALVAKLRKAATFNQGFATTEYLASAIIDLRLHSMDPAGLDAAEFERETLAKLGMPSELVMRHRTPQFGHVFESEGYAAGYYGYIWSEVLTADAAQAFAESPGGFYDKDLAARMVKYLFAPRNSIAPMEAYSLFRGRPPKVEALVKARGLSPGE